MKYFREMALVPLMIFALILSGSPLSAQSNPRKKSLGRQIMRSGFNRLANATQAVIVDDGPLVHTAQILPWGNEGEIVGKGDLARQTETTLENVLIVLKASGAVDGALVKIDIYLSQPEAMSPALEIMRRKLGPSGMPAICCVVGTLPHPDALIAMDAVAVAASEPENHAAKRFHAGMRAGKDTAAAVLPGGGRYYISGQAKDGPLPEAVPGTLAGLESTLTFLGLEKSNVVQLKAFLQPMSEAASVRAEIARFFAPETPPPVVLVEWSSATNTPIEIEMIVADNKPQVTTGDSVEFLTPPTLPVSKVFSRVAHVNHGRMIYFSAIYGSDPGDASVQLNDIFVNLDNLLARKGTDFDHLVKATYYVTDRASGDKLNEIRPKYYNPARPPAASKALVKGVGLPDRTVTLDLIAVAR